MKKETAEDRICQYCNEPISDAHYTYLWFPTHKAMKPVHAKHISYKSKEKTYYDKSANKTARTEKPPKQ